MNNHLNQKLMILVQRHLGLESQLASALERLNAATTSILAIQGLKGPTAQDVLTLEPMTQEVQSMTLNVAQGRETLLSRAQSEMGKQYTSLKELLADAADSALMQQLRSDILQRCGEAQAGLVNNQATLHYTFDFHRKYLAGVFQYDADHQNYRPDGQTQDPPGGNLLGRTC